MKKRIALFAYILVLAIYLFGCGSFSDNEQSENNIPSPKDPLFITMQIEDSEIFYYESYSGQVISGETFYHYISFGYAFDSFSINDINQGQELTIDESLVDKVITIHLIQLEIYTITIVYQSSLDYQRDHLTFEVTERTVFVNIRFWYIDLEDFYFVDEFYMDEEMTEIFDPMSTFTPDTVLYADVHRHATVFLTIITDRGLTFTEELKAGKILAFSHRPFEESEWSFLERSEKVDQVYLNATMTIEVQEVTLNSDMTLYLKIGDKERYLITFVVAPLGQKVYDLYGDETLELNYIIADELIDFFNLGVTEWSFYTDENFNNIAPSTLSGSTQTIYVSTYFDYPIHFYFYQDGNFIDDELVDITIGHVLRDQMFAYMFEHYYQYGIQQISSNSNFSDTINLEAWYNGKYTTLHVNLVKKPHVKIDLTLFNPMNGEIIQMDLELNKGSMLGEIFLIYPMILLNSHIYINSALTTLYQGDFVEEDIAIYAIGYINKLYTTTIIFETDIDPITFSKYPSDDMDIISLVVNAIESFEDGEVGGITFWLDAEFTIPYTFEMITNDLSIYIRYEIIS